MWYQVLEEEQIRNWGGNVAMSTAFSTKPWISKDLRLCPRGGTWHLKWSCLSSKESHYWKDSIHSIQAHICIIRDFLRWHRLAAKRRQQDPCKIDLEIRKDLREVEFVSHRHSMCLEVFGWAQNSIKFLVTLKSMTACLWMQDVSIKRFLLAWESKTGVSLLALCGRGGNGDQKKL